MFSLRKDPQNSLHKTNEFFSQAVFSWELKQGEPGFSVLFLPQVLQVLDYTSGLNPERGLSQGDVAIWNVATTVLPTKYKRTIALLQ